MGTWGVNILYDDTAADVHGEYFERYNAGESHDAIAANLISFFGDDENDRVGLWLGLSKAQWECGVLSVATMNEVRQIVEGEQYLDRWGPPGDQNRNARDRALRQFLTKLATPNPRPKKRRKSILRKPVFQPGDCLAIRLSDGEYGPAIVTAAPPEHPRPGADTYGINVVALLNYKAAAPPTAEVFERRDILRLTHHKWQNKPEVCRVIALHFKGEREKFAVVCRTDIRGDDPVDLSTISGWGFAEQIVWQRRWDAGDHT